MKTPIPAAWLPAAKMKRVIVHWTAGGPKANATDREHYHLLVEQSGNWVRGDHEITDNEAPLDLNDYAAHTRAANSDSIGMSLCGMHGAQPEPFFPGPSPLTKSQWDEICDGLAQVCRAYNIPVTRKTVITHAEVPAELGKPQPGKWDITRLPWRPDLIGARAVGDHMRAMVQARLDGAAIILPSTQAHPLPDAPPPKPRSTAPTTAGTAAGAGAAAAGGAAVVGAMAFDWRLGLLAVAVAAAAIAVGIWLVNRRKG